jgi:hypothetical protein
MPKWRMPPFSAPQFVKHQVPASAHLTQLCKYRIPAPRQTLRVISIANILQAYPIGTKLLECPARDFQTSAQGIVEPATQN